MHVLRVALLSVVVGCSAGAPVAGPGLSEGETCGSSLSCSDGLSCECGVCTLANGRPLACPDLSNLCPSSPSACFAVCGDLSIVGPADCIDGLESCAFVGGVLQRDCDFTTCWGVAEVGQVCIAGTYVCLEGQASDGRCYTSDCLGEPALCVSTCGEEAGAETPQRCVASSWLCEAGFPEEECGACRGQVPACVSSCEEGTPLAPAICDVSARDWSCAHLVTPTGAPVPVTSCCEAADGGCREDSAEGDAGVPSEGGGG